MHKTFRPITVLNIQAYYTKNIKHTGLLQCTKQEMHKTYRPIVHSSDSQVVRASASVAV